MSDAIKTPERASIPRATLSRAQWFAIALLVLIAGVLGGVIGAYLPRLAGAAENDRLSDAETLGHRLAASFDQEQDLLKDLEDAVAQAKARLDAIDMRLSAIEGASANQPGGVVPRLSALETKSGQSAEALAALAARVNSVEAAVPSNLPQQLQTFASKSAASDLDARLAKLEAANTANTLRNAATMLALADVARAAERAEPFVAERDTLAATAPGDPSLKVISSLADRGVPTIEMLRARFPDAARAALNAERKSAAGGFMTRLWNGMLELIGVRRVGDLPGATTEARLARAQTALDGGHLAQATAEVAAVKPPAAPPLSAWLDDARARLDLDRAIADMKTRVVQALAATGAPAQPAPSGKTP